MALKGCKSTRSDEDERSRNWNTPSYCKGFKPANLKGIRFADIIRASGHMRRANRPDK